MIKLLSLDWCNLKFYRKVTVEPFYSNLVDKGHSLQINQKIKHIKPISMLKLQVIHKSNESQLNF